MISSGIWHQKIRPQRVIRPRMVKISSGNVQRQFPSSLAESLFQIGATKLVSIGTPPE